MRNFFKKFKKPILIILAIALSLVLLSQTTEGKHLLLPAGLIDAVRSFFADNPNLSAADYKDGTIILIKPVATGVGEGRYEAGDIVEIRGGEEMYKRFGKGDFLGSSEKTNLLPVYYPGKLTEEQKKELLAPEYEIERNKMILRRKVGVDYTKFLNTEEVLKVRSFEKLDRLPEIDLSSIIKKSSEQKSVIKIPEYLIRIESVKNSFNKFARKIIPYVFAATESIKTIMPSGGDYTTLNAWEAGEQADLVALDRIAIAKIDGTWTSADTTAVTIDGWTNSATDYIDIRGNWTGDKWDTTKYRLDGGAYTTDIQVREQFVRLSQLQIIHDNDYNDGQNAIEAEYVLSASDIRISKSFIWAASQRAISFNEDANAGNTGTIRIWNNIIYGGGVTYPTGVAIGSIVGTAVLYNNTFYNLATCINNGYSGTVAINNLFYTCAINASGTFAAGTNYNASDGASIGYTVTGGGNTSDRVLQSFTFTSTSPTTSGFLHLASTDAGAKDYGVSDPGSGLFLDDIDGVTRTTNTTWGFKWDIGADEVTPRITGINTPLSGRFKDSSLVGYWSFDGANMGTTSATDLSGNSNTGWLLNGPQKVPGINGQALKFDGVNDYVDAADGGGLNLVDGDFTVGAWAKSRTFDTASLWQRIVYKGETSTKGYSISVTNSIAGGAHFIFGIRDASGTYYKAWSNGGKVLNKWYHIVAVYKSGTLDVYVDGVLDTGADNGGTPTINTATNLQIGQRGDNLRRFDGLIDEVRVYNRALSAMEIAEQYRAGAARMKVNSPPSAPFGNSGLVGYWSFNGQDTTWTSATAGTTNDLSGNNNTGTMTNMSRSTSPVPGINGQALSFDGTNNYVNIPDPNLVEGLSAMTASAWAKSNITVTTDGRGVVAQYRGTGGDSFNLELRNIDNMAFDVNTGVTVIADANADLADTSWHHYVGVYTGSNVLLYVDGVLQNDQPAQTGTIITSTNPVTIGTYDSARNWEGLIDEVRIYNRALSASEITDLYRLGAARVKFKQ